MGALSKIEFGSVGVNVNDHMHHGFDNLATVHCRDTWSI